MSGRSYRSTARAPRRWRSCARSSCWTETDCLRRGPYHRAGCFPNCQVSFLALFCPGGRDHMRTLQGLAVWIGFVSLAAAQGPTIGACPVFPADNIWNTRVDQLPVHPSSSTWVATIGINSPVHPDFGSGTWDGGPIGIPFVTV